MLPLLFSSSVQYMYVNIRQFWRLLQIICRHPLRSAANCLRSSRWLRLERPGLPLLSRSWFRGDNQHAPFKLVSVSSNVCVVINGCLLAETWFLFSYNYKVTYVQVIVFLFAVPTVCSASALCRRMSCSGCRRFHSCSARNGRSSASSTSACGH